MAYVRWLFSDRGMSQRGGGIVFFGCMLLMLTVADIALVVVCWGSPVVWLGLGMTAPITLLVAMALWHEVTD